MKQLRFLMLLILISTVTVGQPDHKRKSLFFEIAGSGGFGSINYEKHFLKKRNIVIYCGCCPFKDCPNIRPAFSLLNSMKFTNHKLLNLPLNLKTDWINHGYPMSN